MEAQGGRIWLEPGRAAGSSFCLWLPSSPVPALAGGSGEAASPGGPSRAASPGPAQLPAGRRPADAAAAALRQADHVASTTGSNPVPSQLVAGDLLLVDDDPFLLRSLRRLLPDLHRVVLAGSAEAALLALDAQPFDVVVTDVHMPGMSGIDLLAA